VKLSDPECDGHTANWAARALAAQACFTSSTHVQTSGTIAPPRRSFGRRQIPYRRGISHPPVCPRRRPPSCACAVGRVSHSNRHGNCEQRYGKSLQHGFTILPRLHGEKRARPRYSGGLTNAASRFVRNTTNKPKPWAGGGAFNSWSVPIALFDLDQCARQDPAVWLYPPVS